MQEEDRELFDLEEPKEEEFKLDEMISFDQRDQSNIESSILEKNFHQINF